MSPADKMAVWDGVVVVGETARIKCESSEHGLRVERF